MRVGSLSGAGSNPIWVKSNSVFIPDGRLLMQGGTAVGPLKGLGPSGFIQVMLGIGTRHWQLGIAGNT